MNERRIRIDKVRQIELKETLIKEPVKIPEAISSAVFNAG
jgi:hypothetical protein